MQAQHIGPVAVQHLILLGAVCGGLAAAPARAQWTATQFATPGATQTFLVNVRGGDQVGYARINGRAQASVWHGTPESRTPLMDLSSTSASSSNSLSSTHQFGVIDPFSNPRASMWSGSVGTLVSLHPAGATASYVSGADETFQMGTATFAGVTHAGMWSGSAASWLDLHPGGTTPSVGTDVADGEQVGYVGGVQNWERRAYVWRSTAASGVDLNPPGVTGSAALSVSQGQQVGYTSTNEITHAALWTGTAASWVDLTPPGGFDFWALRTFHGRQVGYGLLNGKYRASTWSGTAQSWEDLSVFLPSSLIDCRAYGIWDDGRTVTVVGIANGPSGAPTVGVLWQRPVCRGDFDRSGTLEVQDIFAFVNAWFAGDPRADYNGRGLRTQDIFDYLNAWFAGC